MNAPRPWLRLATLGLGACIAWPALAASPSAGSASDAARRATSHAAMPAANFFVEWRIRPTAAGAGQAAVFTSRSATTGGSGFGPGAVVVGNAPGAGSEGSQGLRVANGQEGRLALDRPGTRTIYDLSWSLPDRHGQDTVPGTHVDAASRTGGTASHEEVVHHVQGLRVVPRWIHGDTLPLELDIVRDAQTMDDRALDLRTTVQLSLGEWTAVARLGSGDDELQVRVTRR